jgi:hypothetical protein
MAIVTTTYGPMDDALLKCRTGGHEDEDEKAEWMEYYLRSNGELVHRSAHVTVKKLGESADVVAAIFG